MKKILVTILFMAAHLCHAQIPQAFSFQSIATDKEGIAIANQDVSIKISLIAGSAMGNSVYSETHSAVTNSSGLFNLSIGNGNPVNGTFAGINWGNNRYFIKTEIDISGNTNYVFAGTVQLVSVPYALHALDAAVVLKKGERGDAGPKGNEGAIGPVGATGEQGVPAAAPPVEPCNCEGRPNWIGPRGQKGPQGPKGEDAPPGGSTGPRGPAGPKGPQGDPGGPEGKKGETGVKGPLGPAGPKGIPGEIGETGPKGDTGPATGSAGVTGLAGNTGQKGPKGPAGDQGPPGEYTGIAVYGATGPDGPKGLRGATGQQGLPNFGILIMKSVVPSQPFIGDFYVDDGTNTTDGKPHLRVFTEAGWLDL